MITSLASPCGKARKGHRAIRRVSRRHELSAGLATGLARQQSPPESGHPGLQEGQPSHPGTPASPASPAARARTSGGTHRAQRLEGLLVAHGIAARLDHKLDAGVDRLLALLLRYPRKPRERAGRDQWLRAAAQQRGFCSSAKAGRRREAAPPVQAVPGLTDFFEGICGEGTAKARVRMRANVAAACLARAAGPNAGRETAERLASPLRSLSPPDQEPGLPTSSMLRNAAPASGTHPCNDGATGQENTVRVGCSHSQGRALERRRRHPAAGHLPATCAGTATPLAVRASPHRTERDACPPSCAPLRRPFPGHAQHAGSRHCDARYGRGVQVLSPRRRR